MFKNILKSHYFIAGVVVFLLLFFVGIFGLGTSWGESLLGSAVLTVIGIGSLWWSKEVW